MVGAGLRVAETSPSIVAGYSHEGLALLGRELILKTGTESSARVWEVLSLGEHAGSPRRCGGWSKAGFVPLQPESRSATCFYGPTKAMSARSRSIFAGIPTYSGLCPQIPSAGLGQMKTARYYHDEPWQWLCNRQCRACPNRRAQGHR